MPPLTNGGHYISSKGGYPDGYSAMMLVGARLRQISTTKWGSRQYILANFMRWEYSKIKASPYKPTCSSGAARSVGLFRLANADGTLIRQNQMCAKLRTLPIFLYAPPFFIKYTSVDEKVNHNMRFLSKLFGLVSAKKVPTVSRQSDACRGIIRLFNSRTKPFYSDRISSKVRRWAIRKSPLRLNFPRAASKYLHLASSRTFISRLA